MQINLHTRAFPTIFFKGTVGLTRFDLVIYNMGREQRPGSGTETIPLASVSIPQVVQSLGYRVRSIHLLI